MLRRPATKIRLSPEDILEYDESLQRQQEQEQLQLQQKQQQEEQYKQQQQNSSSILQEQINTNDFLSGMNYKSGSSSVGTSSKQPSQSRDERIGVRKN
ncbi:uncharacterized protein SPAPADRAFT_63295 [Spathaspora passalidarum NRRL Y-27907]|uniref:Uncharacterized protein n=1 Tax=Spathaspora passalidarum (strain NRRL Y-27907 / 11-Y1) TaxID=619300 RepID=G3AU90_SPAPN|nr:uncharacterized protein SPAPADRAFT_63295 [Spathaspora passalidarum NRRL Y-27907]EGW30466.1 hypothetical protein SPAPADRAFT_63295 [Spathaspora passalidarum NRRL Y-27907]